METIQTDVAIIGAGGAGLRAAIVHTVAPQAEPSRIVAPSGFVLPPSGRH